MLSTSRGTAISSSHLGLRDLFLSAAFGQLLCCLSPGSPSACSSRQTRSFSARESCAVWSRFRATRDTRQARKSLNMFIVRRALEISQLRDFTLRCLSLDMFSGGGCSIARRDSRDATRFTASAPEVPQHVYCQPRDFSAARFLRDLLCFLRLSVLQLDKRFKLTSASND